MIVQGDSIEFSVTLANLDGFIEWLEWEKPTFSQAPNVTALNYDKDSWTSKLFGLKNTSQKIFCDLNRICELEDAIVEWYEERYFQRNEKFDLSFLTQGENAPFKVVDIKYAGIDGSICKAVFEAIKPGKFNSKLFHGIGIHIYESKCELSNEVKRIGYLRDRVIPLELRVGDTFVLYISTTIA